MTVEELLSRLNESLQKETEKKKKQEIIEVINKIQNESLYSAVIYDFLTLRYETNLTYEEAYKIPAIRQAFLDSIKNPSLKSTKENLFIDLVELFTSRMDIEVLKQDQEFNEIINDLSYEQAERLFGEEQINLLFEDKKYYDILIAKAHEDERFYFIFAHSKHSIEDGTSKIIAKYNKGNNKLTHLNPEDQIAVLKQLDNTADLSNFLINFQRYDKTVIEFIISSPNFGDQVILAQAKNEYGSPLIPKEYESSFVSNYLEFIKELSFKQKYNFIYKMQDPEMQKYLIQKLNFVKNLVSQNDYGNFFDGIKDKDFLVECICDDDILDGLKNIHLRKVTALLNKEQQLKLYNSEEFQKYLNTLGYLLIGVIALFDEEIIDEIIPKLKKITIGDLMTIFEESKNHKYIQDVINSIKEAESEQEENLYENLSTFVGHTVLTRNNLKELTNEEFEYFLSIYKPIKSIRSTEMVFDRFMVYDKLNEEEQTIYDSIDFSKPLTDEEKEVVSKYRLNRVFEFEIQEALKMLNTTEERCLNSVGYAIFPLLTTEEQKILLDRLTLECLMNNIASCETILNYCYDLYLKDPKIFDNINQTKSTYVAHSDDELPPEALKKLRTLFSKANSKARANLLHGTIVEDEEISKMLKEEIKQDPNIYSGDMYKNKLGRILAPEEMEQVLRALSLNNILKYFSEFTSDDKHKETANKILLERKNEILHEINNINFDIFSNIYPDRIILRLLDITNDKETLLKGLNSKLLISLYNTDTIVSRAESNKMIIDIITQNPSILLTTPNDKTKQLLNTITATKLRNLIDKLTLNEVISLFAKTQNKLLEEKLMLEFEKQPYFINNSDIALEEVLNRLEQNNKDKIYSTIDEQFNALELPYDIKNKLRKSSYDEKLFLVYGVKENLFNEEKYQLINELLKQDPFALNSLNIKLLEDDIFIISKNIIPKIYRYESLTVSYINLLKNNDKRSKLMLLMIEHLNKTTHNIDIYTKKLDTIIKYLTCVNDHNIERINPNNIPSTELQELEEYILIDSTDYLIESSIMSFYTNTLSRKENITGTSFSDIENKRIANLDEQMLNATEVEKAKDILFKKYFKIDLSQVDALARKYAKSFNTIKKDIVNQTLVDLFEEIQMIRNLKTIEEVQELYYNYNKKHNVSEYLYMFEEFDHAYSKNIAENIKGYINGQETTIIFEVEGVQREIPVIELDSNFEMIVHSTDAYGSMMMINDNYFDSWNFSDKTSNHGICTCFISNSNLGTAPVAGKGVMFGFTKLNAKSITSMAPYDLVSRNEGIITTSKHPPMFTDTKDLVDYTRHTHNEIVLERRNVSEDSKFPVIQPDCIVIFEEMTPEIKSNALVAQQHFKEQGIDLPIIYINRQKVVELEARRVDEMLNIYEQNPSIELLSEIINKYETNRCGLDHDKNLDLNELFQKDRIMNTILKTIEYLKTTNDITNINKLIYALEQENYKFEMVHDNVGERAHTFDLLDENLQKIIEELKSTYGDSPTTINSNFTI